MKKVMKFLYEIFLAIVSRKTLGSSFRLRLKYIRCDYVVQETIKKKLNVELDHNSRKGVTEDDRPSDQSEDSSRNSKSQ